MGQDSADLVERYAAGDQDAADAIFARYLSRLMHLARARMSAKLKTRIDPEDVVMSAYRSFFRVIRGSAYSYDADAGELWSLLVGITLRKVYRQANFHYAQKRNVASEENFASSFMPNVMQGSPSPAEIAEFSDRIEHLMSTLSPQQQRVLELRLQESSIEEIAAQVGQSERTVRRHISAIREKLQKDLESLPAISVVPVTRPTQQLNDPVNVKKYEAPLQYSDFILHEHIGSGGIGKVYRATRIATGELVAVKFLRRSFNAIGNIVDRFVREASIIGKLQHPNVIQVHGLGKTPNNAFFIVIDYVKERNLQTVIDHSLPETSQIITWMQEIGVAIEHSHQHGVIHCDLKPSNVLLSHDGSIQVTDFGMARVLTDSDETTYRMEGTAAFMAPEQVSDAWGSVSRTTDVYGLGAILFTLLTGHPPTTGKSVPEIIGNVLTQTPSIEIANDTMRNELSKLCLKCLEKSPELRLQSVSDFLVELKAHSEK